MDNIHVAAEIRKKEGKVDQEGVFRGLIRASMTNGTKCSLEKPSGTPGSAETCTNGVKNIKSLTLLWHSPSLI